MKFLKKNKGIKAIIYIDENSYLLVYIKMCVCVCCKRALEILQENNNKLTMLSFNFVVNCDIRARNAIYMVVTMRFLCNIHKEL